MSISVRNWSADGRGFYWSPVFTGVLAEPTLNYFDLAQKNDQEVFSVPSRKAGEVISALTTSPDGKAFAYRANAEMKTRLMEVTTGRK